MAARTPSFGIAHPTVVPTNFDPVDGADREVTDDADATTDDADATTDHE